MNFSYITKGALLLLILSSSTSNAMNIFSSNSTVMSTIKSREEVQEKIPTIIECIEQHDSKNLEKLTDFDTYVQKNDLSTLQQNALRAWDHYCKIWRTQKTSYYVNHLALATGLMLSICTNYKLIQLVMDRCHPTDFLIEMTLAGASTGISFGLLKLLLKPWKLDRAYTNFKLLQQKVDAKKQLLEIAQKVK